MAVAVFCRVVSASQSNPQEPSRLCPGLLHSLLASQSYAYTNLMFAFNYKLTQSLHEGDICLADYLQRNGEWKRKCLQWESFVPHRQKYRDSLALLT